MRWTRRPGRSEHREQLRGFYVEAAYRVLPRPIARSRRCSSATRTSTRSSGCPRLRAAAAVRPRRLGRRRHLLARSGHRDQVRLLACAEPEHGRSGAALVQRRTRMVVLMRQCCRSSSAAASRSAGGAATVRGACSASCWPVGGRSHRRRRGRAHRRPSGSPFTPPESAWRRGRASRSA